MSETVEQIVAEMQRSPDAQYLLEWIQVRCGEVTSEFADEIDEAVAAYFEAIEEL